MDSISKNYFFYSSGSEIVQQYLDWTKKYDINLNQILCNNFLLLKKAIEIEKEKRKDFIKYSQIISERFFLFDEYFYPIGYNLPTEYMNSLSSLILKEFINTYDSKNERDAWWSKIVTISVSDKFAKDKKSYRLKPDE